MMTKFKGKNSRVPLNVNKPDKFFQKSGIVGKIWGSHDDLARLNIAAIILILLILLLFIIIIVSLYCNRDNSETIKVISPIITLILGYLFGKKN